MTSLHHVQRSIILSLATTAPARFSDIKPPRIPNNAFSYHLKKLVDAGYVESTDEGYSLTRKALKLVVFAPVKSKPGAAHVPVTITINIIENEAGEKLLLNRNNRPYQGWYGFPSGIIHSGETFREAAKREIYEKTSIEIGDAEQLREVGVLNFRYINSETGDIFVHAIAFVFFYKYTNDPTLIADKQTKSGQLSWSTLSREHILPEVFAANDMLKSTLYTSNSADFMEPAHVPILVDNTEATPVIV